MKISDLQESRSGKVQELRNLADKIAKENRNFSDDEKTRFEALKAEVVSIESRISAAETVAAMERRADATVIAGERGLLPDLRSYSLARAIRSNGRLDGVEAECHAELSKGREPRGIMVPTSVLIGEYRTQQVGDSTLGGWLVDTKIAPVQDRPRPALKIEQMGATIIRGLTGNLDLPDIASSGTTHWIGELASTVRSDVTFRKTYMTPKTVSAEYSMSRAVQNQANESVEAILRMDLGRQLATAVDAAAIKNRSGMNTEPQGILDNVSVETVTTESYFPDTIANLVSNLEVDDFAGARAILTNPTVMGLARKVRDGESRPIPFSQVFHGERVEVTTNVPANAGVSSNKSAIICGLWDQLIVGYWSGVDILSNPYTLGSSGGTLLHAFLDLDLALRTPGAFKVALI